MLNKLTERVFYMPQEEKIDRPLLGLVCGNKYSLIIDAGTSPKHAGEFMLHVSEMKAIPARYVAITHFHGDHVFGIAAMNLPTIGHHKTQEKIKEIQQLPWDDESLAERVRLGLESQFTFDCIKAEIPDRNELVIENLDIIFDSSIEVDLGGVTCIIENIGGTHTEDSCLIYIPEEKVLFMGDCIYGRRFKGAYGYTKAELEIMVDRLKKYDAEHYLVSHMEPQTKEQMIGFLDGLIAIAELIGDETSAEKATKKYIEKFGKAPNEEDAFYIGCFVNVNSSLS
jgi:glyoxylase-like metal-dependent hydrolase (beta-lactamase superfamily II)